MLSVAVRMLGPPSRRARGVGGSEAPTRQGRPPSLSPASLPTGGGGVCLPVGQRRGEGCAWGWMAVTTGLEPGVLALGGLGPVGSAGQQGGDVLTQGASLLSGWATGEESISEGRRSHHIRSMDFWLQPSQGPLPEGGQDTRAWAASSSNAPVAPGGGRSAEPLGLRGPPSKGHRGVRARTALGSWEPPVPGQPGVHVLRTGDSCAWDQATQPRHGARPSPRRTAQPRLAPASAPPGAADAASGPCPSSRGSPPGVHPRPEPSEQARVPVLPFAAATRVPSCPSPPPPAPRWPLSTRSILTEFLFFVAVFAGLKKCAVIDRRGIARRGGHVPRQAVSRFRPSWRPALRGARALGVVTGTGPSGLLSPVCLGRRPLRPVSRAESAAGPRVIPSCGGRSSSGLPGGGFADPVCGAACPSPS